MQSYEIQAPKMEVGPKGHLTSATLEFIPFVVLEAQSIQT